MTREEAILCIKGIKNLGHDMFTEQKDFQECLDMAIKALEKEPCEGCKKWKDKLKKELRTLENIMEQAPVTPQPKTGHWIDIMVGDMPAQVCDQCKTFYPLSYTGGGHNYCPSCGSRMVEPQESEDE
jgi:hypothetical protein